jgi:tetratricopeptide (TPR) repeat protein
MFYRGKKRIRKDPDVFQKTFAGVFEQLRGSGMLLVLLLVGVLVVMTVIWVVSSRRASREADAQAKLRVALEQPEAREQRAELQKLAEQAPGTLAAPAALLLQAALLQSEAADALAAEAGRREDDLKRAQALLDKLLADYPRHPLAPMARERRALILEDLAAEGGNPELFEQAADAYHSAAAAVQNTPAAYLAGKLRYGEARCLERLGKKDQAVTTLELALQAEPAARRSAWREAAVGLLAQLRPAKDLRVKGAAQDQPPPAEKPAGEAAPGPAPKGGEGQKGQK